MSAGVEMAEATKDLPDYMEEVLVNLSVVLLHSLEPEDLPEFIAQMALRADPCLLASLPPKPGWTGE